MLLSREEQGKKTRQKIALLIKSLHQWPLSNQRHLATNQVDQFGTWQSLLAPFLAKRLMITRKKAEFFLVDFSSEALKAKPEKKNVIKR